MQLLFSYGTLQQTDVQQATFGRELTGQQDELIGFQQVMLKIKDPYIIQLRGKTHHPILKSTRNLNDRVSGTVFEVTDEELLHADQYEVSDYQRVLASLASGRQAWVYVQIDFQ